MPAKGEVGGVEKFERKLAAKEKRDARRRQKLAAMTPEQRERHERWQQSHMPGGPAERAHRRRQSETKEMLDKLLADRESAVALEPTKPEVDVFA